MTNSVSVTLFERVRTNIVTAELVPINKPPSAMAVLFWPAKSHADDLSANASRRADFPSQFQYAAAKWVPFRTKYTLDLGPGDGRRNVWIGFRWADTNQWSWSGYTVTVDHAPPAIVITNPKTSNTSQPEIQLAGYSEEPLQDITYTLVTAAGKKEQGEGFVSEQHLDSSTFEFTTNWFQCFDLELAVGLNKISLRCEDLVGNVTVTNLAYTLSFAHDKEPPIITLHYPDNNRRIAADDFTVRGHSDDPTARLTGRITSGVQAAEVEGGVERNGTLWIEDVPLLGKTNLLEITATDAAGNSSRTNLTVFRSEMRLHINLPESEELLKRTVTITGTINVQDHSVWVNGVQAKVSGDGTWLARNVPVNEGGTAVFHARAIPYSELLKPVSSSAKKSKAESSGRDSILVEANYGTNGVTLECLPAVNGQFQLHITGTAGKSFVLQASTNLVHWVSILTNLNSGESFDFIDSGAASFPCRFFRAAPFP